MLTLYFKEQTRATRPLWLLEELCERGPRIVYQLKRVDFDGGENKRAEYLALHPHGLVPALVDDGTPVFESAAICLHLADRFLERGLAPALGTPERARYYQWVAWCPATLEPAIGLHAWHTKLFPEAERVPRLAESGRQRFAECLRVLDGVLQRASFMLGERFSTADVLVGGNLLWARRAGLALQGAAAAYLDRLLERPAARRVLA